MPDRQPNPNGPAARRANMEAVQRIIADAEKSAAETIRVASKLESMRRTVFLMIQDRGGEVVIDKAVAMLVNGQAGISKRFEVIADDPTRPDKLIFRIVAPPDTLDEALIGPTPQEAAEAAHTAQQIAPAITWASWEIECVLPTGARWRTSCHGDRTLGEVEEALPEGTRVVVAKLTGRTGKIPEFQEQITFTPPPPEEPPSIIASSQPAT